MLDEDPAALEGAEDEVAIEETESTEGEAEEAVTEEDNETEGDDSEEVEYDLGGGQKVKFAANATAKEVMEAAQAAFKGVEANYTKKQMAVAEQSKALEAEKQAVEKLRNLNDNALDQYSRGLAVKQELEQLQRIDLNTMWQSNPDQARRVSDRVSQKQAEFQRIVNNVSQIEAEQARAEQEITRRRLDEGKAEVERRIPGFAGKYADAVMKYAIANGVPEKDAGNWPANPIVTQMAWKAMQFDALTEKAAKAAKPKPAEAQPVEASKIKGGRKPAFDLVKDADRMSADEWLRRRNAQLRA